jgi:3-methyladenine DNA glycosylase/8-oxoguanine DNA glycosylase
MPPLAKDRLRAIAQWLVSADLDLRPFYALAASHPVMAGVVRSLRGLKPLRPATLFEMAVVAITEQQLSLAAAFRIRTRLIRRFGTQLDDLWVFPQPERLAAAALSELGKCGLSRRKAEYIRDLAQRISERPLDFETFRQEPDERIRDALMSNRGFGEWSVQYILGRGFGRPDSLPSGDTGLRRVVGQYFGEGGRLTADELEGALAGFKPFRGLAAFYLAVHWRLRKRAKPMPTEVAEGRNANRPSRKALLLRVGMDRGTGGALGPIFRNGSFEYIPIPETVPTRYSATYATVPGRHTRSLASVLPVRLAECHPHIDPDFDAATYGDAAPRKRAQLNRLAPGDLLVFYTGLVPDTLEDRPRLFAIGSLRVEQVHHLSAREIGSRDLQRKFGRTAHFLRRRPDRHLALVEGQAGASKLFARAIPFGDGNDRLFRDLAPIGYQGSLLRAVGHWITGPACLRLLERWLRHGPACLVDSDTRLVVVPSSTLVSGKIGRDLVIDDRRLCAGDWVIVRAKSDTGIRAFGRINRIARRDGRRKALASIFWCFDREVDFPRIPGIRSAESANPNSIRRLVSWFAKHYRIGFHR